MLECSFVDPLVTPYIDDALAAADRQLIEEHVRECASCRFRILAESSVRALLRDRRTELRSDSAPATLRARCAAAAGPPVVASVRPAWRRRAAPLALAAALVLVTGALALERATQASARVMSAELTVDHMKCFLVNAVLGTGQAQSEVERSLAAGFGWNARLPERPDEVGLELVGARPCLYGEGRVAHVMYRYHGRPVSLFMLPEKQRAAELLSVWGHEVAVWSSGDRTFVLVAHESRAELQRIAAFVHSAMR